jgi:hypothetical protein
LMLLAAISKRRSYWIAIGAVVFPTRSDSDVPPIIVLRLYAANSAERTTGRDWRDIF